MLIILRCDMLKSSKLLRKKQNNILYPKNFSGNCRSFGKSIIKQKWKIPRHFIVGSLAQLKYIQLVSVVLFCVQFIVSSMSLWVVVCFKTWYGVKLVELWHYIFVHTVYFIVYYLLLVPTNTLIYRVIHKCLRDFRTRLRNTQDRHGRKEHINR